MLIFETPWYLSWPYRGIIFRSFEKPGGKIFKSLKTYLNNLNLCKSQNCLGGKSPLRPSWWVWNEGEALPPSISFPWEQSRMDFVGQRTTPALVFGHQGTAWMVKGLSGHVLCVKGQKIEKREKKNSHKCIYCFTSVIFPQPGEEKGLGFSSAWRETPRNMGRDYLQGMEWEEKGTEKV